MGRGLVAISLMIETPHFDIPFRIEGGKAVTVEQGSLRDIQNCVETILRTHVGEREGIPAFGIYDPTFTNIPVDRQLLVSQVTEFEPRAIVLIEESVDYFDSMLSRLSIRVSPIPADQDRST